MGSLTSPEKKPLQRKAKQEEEQLAKSAQPPSFELSAGSAQPPAQMQEAPDKQKEAEQAAPTQEETPAAPKSEADQMRDAVVQEAMSWVNKEFITKEKIAEIAAANNMPNYTTCFEFAGKMQGAGSKAVYGKDAKKQQATNKEMVKTKADWEKAVQARNTAKAYGQSVKLFEDAITRVKKDLVKAEKEVADLRVVKEGENPQITKQRTKQANILEKLRVGALLRVIKVLEGQRDKWQGKIDENNLKADEIDQNNSAMIKAEDDMPESVSEDGTRIGGPQPGEYIILAQAKTAKYGKSGTQVDLASGSFKHIAVFVSARKAEPGYEIWKTIDGGGTDGKVTELRIRLSDRMIFPANSTNFADVGSASGTKLAGWIDTEEMLKKRDERMAQGKK